VAESEAITQEEPEVGLVLAQAREAMGYSQQDVADELFLTSRVIATIDAGRYDIRTAFIRGYLRSYARLVGLPGDDIVELFNRSREHAEDDLPIRGVTEEEVGSAGFTGPVVQTGIIGLIGVLLVIALVWYLTRESAPEVKVTGSRATDQLVRSGAPVALNDGAGTIAVDPARAQAGDDDPGRDQLALAAKVAAEESGDSSGRQFGGDRFGQEGQEGQEDEAGGDGEGGVAMRSDVIASVDGQRAAAVEVLDAGTGSVTDPETGAQTIAEDDGSTIVRTEDGVVTEPYTEGGTRHINIDAGGADELRFTFTGECWLEIRDASNVAVYSDLNLRGDSLKVKGNAPFRILFGRAPSVGLTFNGRTVDLARYTGADKTAQVTLGAQD